MVRDPYRSDPSPDMGTVLAILADEDARAIVRTLDEPMTAKELREHADIPESTLYRKLDRLTDAGLLEERTRLRRDGRHSSEYTIAFADLTIRRDPETGELAVEVTPAPKAADERLAELWSEVSQQV